MEFSDQLIKYVEDHHKVSEPKLVQELLETALQASLENETSITREIDRQDDVTVVIAQLLIGAMI